MSAVSLATCYRGVCLQPQTHSWNQGPSDTTTRHSALNAAHTHTRTHGSATKLNTAAGAYG